jgi:drug/metabolite transporter (DMT)-like permease
MKDSWPILSFVGLVTLSVMTLIVTYLVRKGLPTVFVLFVLFVVASIVYGTQVFLTRAKPAAVPAQFWLLLLSIGILCAIGNLALFNAAAASPNPGLVVSIVGLQGAVVAVLAVIFLKDRISPVQLIGVVLGVIAVVIIGLGGRDPNATTPHDPKRTPAASDEAHPRRS